MGERGGRPGGRGGEGEREGEGRRGVGEREGRQGGRGGEGEREARGTSGMGTCATVTVELRGNTAREVSGEGGKWEKGEWEREGREEGWE